jgi:hypothetical protein
MPSKFRSHVPPNVVGHIARFFVLTGVAYAAGPLKAGDRAGGDLTGTYPDPSIASGAVGTADFSSTIPAARVAGAGSQAVAPHVLTSINFPIEDYDTADLHSTSANTRLTAPVAGIYRLSANLLWESNPIGQRELIFELNPVSPLAHHSPAWVAAPATAGDMQQSSTEIKLAAGDFLEVRVLQNSGGSLNVTANFFTMSWVAPG